MCDVMDMFGFDLIDDSLCDMFMWIVKMYVNEIFGGLDYCKFFKIIVIENKM